MAYSAITLDSRQEVKRLKTGTELVVENPEGLTVGQQLPLFMDFQKLEIKAVVSKIVEEVGNRTKVYIKLAE